MKREIMCFDPFPFDDEWKGDYPNMASLMAQTMASTFIAKTEKAGACKSLVDFRLWFGENLRVQL